MNNDLGIVYRDATAPKVFLKRSSDDNHLNRELDLIAHQINAKQRFEILKKNLNFAPVIEDDAAVLGLNQADGASSSLDYREPPYYQSVPQQ